MDDLRNDLAKTLAEIILNPEPIGWSYEFQCKPEARWIAITETWPTPWRAGEAAGVHLACFPGHCVRLTKDRKVVSNGTVEG